MGKRDYVEAEVKKPKKRKKKSHKLYALIVLLLGLAIIILAVLVLFYVQKVEVVGNEYCSDQEIIDVVQNDDYSFNTLYILGKYALGYGEQLPCLERLKVSMKTPWAVKVKVREKQIVGYVYTENGYAYFDKEGMVVFIGTELIEGLPNIEGMDVGGVKLYSKLKSSDSGIFKEILETSQEVKKKDLNTDKIICKDNKIYLYIGSICVSLGNSISSEQIAQIPPVMEKLEGMEGTLHLENYSEGKSAITFNMGETLEEK